ncbi:MAG TPA: TetR/AcrR family transcriptional regulator [Pseudolabrys sp.]|nr:TetR/AcrR family transcriptional regulator [Pseudolabrys sp.]
MRVSREKAQENRNRIVAVAGSLLREKGFDGIGVADIMKAADLTHGGFYGHFKSKDELAALACGEALTRSAARWSEVRDNAGTDPFKAMVAHYLSPRQFDGTGRGCALVALGAEAPRQPKAVREVFRDGLAKLLDVLMSALPGTKAARRKKSLAVMAELVGAGVLARAVDDPVLAEEILDAVRHDLLTRVDR